MSFYNKLKNLIARSPVANSLNGVEQILALNEDAEMVSLTVQQIVDLGVGGGEAEYLEYVALLNELLGNQPPTVTVLKNTLGGTPVWTTVTGGHLRGTLAGAFPAAKTVVLTTFNNASPLDSASYILSAGRESNNAVYVKTGIPGTPASALTLTPAFVNVPIVIRVYP